MCENTYFQICKTKKEMFARTCSRACIKNRSSHNGGQLRTSLCSHILADLQTDLCVGTEVVSIIKIEIVMFYTHVNNMEDFKENRC